MRVAFWFLFVFAIAVVFAMVVGGNTAVVTLFWAPYRVDVSFNFAISVLIILFFVTHITWRSISALLKLPEQARIWRQSQRERALHQTLLHAEAHLASGRYTRASKEAKQVMNWLQEHPEMNELGHTAALQQSIATLTAAKAHHFLQDLSQRDQLIEQALEMAKQSKLSPVQDAIALQVAAWAIERNDGKLALQQLANLSAGAIRRTAALRIKLRALQALKEASKALETGRLLIKHRAFSKVASQSLIRGLCFALLEQSRDANQMQNAWAMLQTEEKLQIDVVCFAAKRMSQVDGSSLTVRQWLLPVWEQYIYKNTAESFDITVIRKLVLALQEHLQDLDGTWLANIEKAYLKRPNEASLQYLFGLACLQQKLWGKAEVLLSASATGLKGTEFERQTWCALAALSEQKGQQEKAALYYKQAALVSN
jgi:HemY protein